MANTEQTPKRKRKKSSVRHTRAIQLDRSKRPTVGPPDEQVAEGLTELIHPATLNQLDYYRQLGLRERVLTLPVMVALVISMIWRDIGSVCELVRVLRAEGFLWTSPTQVSQQALSQRLLTFPAELFLRVLLEVLPLMQARCVQRQRPMSEDLAWAQTHYTAVLAVDGSTLDALLRKVGLLRDLEGHPLAGRMTALLDLCSRLPWQIWYEQDPKAHDQRFWLRILAAVKDRALLVFDLGYTNFAIFAQLTAQRVTFITRAKRNLVYSVQQVLLRSARVHDRLVWIGKGDDRQLVRLVEILHHGAWYRYLTNELDPEYLPTAYVVSLYWQRWRIEDAYKIVKRLLGLAYFWVGSENGVQLQLWATWIVYAVLVDLTDAVAEVLNTPFAALSLEMVYRGLYHFTQAFHRGDATDPVSYLAVNAKWLGVIKRKRTRSPLQLLDLTNTNGP